MNPVWAIGIGLSGERTGEGAQNMRKSRTKKLNDVESDSAIMDREAIEKLAYHFWLERGCPEGSASEDWLRAERVLRAKESHPVLVEAVMRAAG
jgi:hypothetical protein